jgi:hypothetical protein
MKLIYEAKVSIEIDLAKAGVTNEEVEEKIKEVGLSGLKKHIECSLVKTFFQHYQKEWRASVSLLLCSIFRSSRPVANREINFAYKHLWHRFFNNRTTKNAWFGTEE